MEEKSVGEEKEVLINLGKEVIIVGGCFNGCM